MLCDSRTCPSYIELCLLRPLHKESSKLITCAKGIKHIYIYTLTYHILQSQADRFHSGLSIYEPEWDWIGNGFVENNRKNYHLKCLEHCTNHKIMQIENRDSIQAMIK